MKFRILKSADGKERLQIRESLSGDTSEWESIPVVKEKDPTCCDEWTKTIEVGAYTWMNNFKHCPTCGKEL